MVEITKPEQVELKISNDDMRAFIIFSEPVNSIQYVIKEDIEELLIENGIVNGILSDVILSLVSGEKEYDKRYLIAIGTEAVDGKDGYLEYFIDTNTDCKPKLKEDGKVDYRNLNMFSFINEGDLLVRRVLPTQGINGVDIKNEIVKAKDGRPAKKLPRGKNVIVSEDETELTAAISGHISIVDEKIIVSSVLDINGDINNSTGNIVSNGSVHIKGNVLTGFSVTADGDITIEGVVEGAVIKSKSHIYLKNGVQGLDKAFIKADGDIIAKYIEHSEVISGNNIISESIIHSKVICFGYLELQGKNASVIGGVTSVKEYVKAKYIGSPMSTVTEIKVGNDPQMIFEYERLSRQLNDYKQAILKEEETFEKLTKLTELESIKHKIKNSLILSLQNKANLRAKISETEDELRIIVSKLKNKRGLVLAEEKIYPGVRIVIADAALIIKEELKYAALFNSEGRIKLDSIYSR